MLDTLAVHGETTADGRSIVLLATGNEYEIRTAAKQMQLLTPLVKKSDPTGALVLPLSWPAVIQLTHTFPHAWHPGPRLCAWITDQMQRRTNNGVGLDLNYRVPEGLTPRPYQVDGALMIAANGRALLFDDPGTGKTITTILGLVERNGQAELVGPVFPVLCVVPASVVDPWVEAWQTWAPRWKAVAWRGEPRRRHALAGTADVYVTAYDTARVDAHGPLLQLAAKSVVIDECFPAGTQVETPTGPSAIEALRVGDEVIGVDHTTGQPVITTVRHTFKRRTTKPLITVNGVVMTASHPVWTTHGYMTAAAIRATDEVCSTLINLRHGELHAELRVVRADVHEEGQAQRAASVLRPYVLSEVAHVEPGIRRVARHTEAPGSSSGEHAPLAGEPRGASHAAGTSGGAEQPAQGSERAGQGQSNATRAWLPDAERREWPAHRAAEAVGRPAWLGDGGICGVAAPLLDRRGEHSADDRDRVRRGEPQEPDGPGAGRPEGHLPAGAGLDGAALHEQAGARRHRDGNGTDHGGRRVFNIETGTGNYVAGGLLVHNCHLIKSPHAARSVTARKLAKKAENFVALSGTPITHHPGDLWPTLEALAPVAWPSRERWVNRYCQKVPGDYKDQIIGLHPSREPEFRTVLTGQHRRVAKADVLAQLPPKVYSVRHVDLPPDWRKVYDQMEAEMIARLPDGEELSVMSVLAQLTRLGQLASAAADVTVTQEPDASGELRDHVSVRLKAPSWKVDALMEVLAERPGEPVVTFAPSRQLVMLAGAQATKAGLHVGYVVGEQSMRDRTETVDAFQQGKYDLLCATTGAGGVGLTLTAAKTVVFLMRPWSLVEATQAEDRLHRIGAERHDCIEVVDVVATDTIDSRVRAVLRDKAGQLAELLQDKRIVTELLGGRSTRKAAA